MKVIIKNEDLEYGIKYIAFDGEELIRMSHVNNVELRIMLVWPFAGLATDTVGYDSKGIPSLNIYTGEETSSFHTQDDKMESLDIPGMALIT